MFPLQTYAKAVRRWNDAGRPVRSQQRVHEIFEQHCRPCVFFDDGQFDLAAARRAWLNETDSDESSDFLLYKDSDGKYADFHALRHTFITNLCKADVSPKTAQALARYCDISLTMNIYCARRPGGAGGCDRQVAGGV